jgi:hypothetical protein
VVRGFAVLWMISVQLFDMFFRHPFLYNEGIYHEAISKYINWFSIFMVIAGFSLRLMFEKYDTRKFYWKVLKRTIYFACIGLFLTAWCEFKIAYIQVFDREIIGAIGINLLLLSLWFPVNWITSNRYFHTVWFGCGCSIMIVANQIFALDGWFNVFWLQSFMMFGVLLATLRQHKFSWIFGGVTLLSVGLSQIHIADYSNRNIEFWFLNTGVITLLVLLTSKIRTDDVLVRTLNYFGTHSLFFYFFHFSIFGRLLLSSGLINRFELTESIILTLTSVTTLVMFQKGYSLIREKRAHAIQDLPAEM